MKDFYKILGISSDSDADTIKKTYRKLSLEHHPDRGGDGEKFKEINEAYDTLGDNEKKQRYDMMNNGGNIPFPPGSVPFPFGGPNGAQMNDIFGMMFGGGHMPNNFPFPPNVSGGVKIFHNGIPININGGVNGPTFNRINKPPPIHKQVEIDIAMSYTGCSIPIPIERTINENNVNKTETETIYVTVPKGIDNNESIVIPDKGNIIIINQEIKGDIKLSFVINNTSEFTRNGLDLIYKKNISLKEALCGLSFDLKYINGKTFKIQNNKGNIIAPSFKKTIPKLGFMRNEHIGNLIIEFNIIFPNTLTNEQIDNISNIL